MVQRHGLDELHDGVDNRGALLTAPPRNERRRIAFVTQEPDVNLADVGALNDLHELACPDGADFDELGREKDDVVTTVRERRRLDLPAEVARRPGRDATLVREASQFCSMVLGATANRIREG